MPREAAGSVRLRNGTWLARVMVGGARRSVPLGHRVRYGFLAREGPRTSEARELAWSDLDLTLWKGFVELRGLDVELAAAQSRQVEEIDLEAAADHALGIFEDLANTHEDAPREARRRMFSRTVARIELEFEVDPAKAHRKSGRHRCVGGPITVTPLVEEAASLLPCDRFLVGSPG